MPIRTLGRSALDLDRLRNVGVVDSEILTVEYLVCLRGRRFLGHIGQSAIVTAFTRNGPGRSKRGGTDRFVAKAILIVANLGVLGVSFAETVTKNIIVRMVCSTATDWPQC